MGQDVTDIARFPTLREIHSKREWDLVSAVQPEFLIATTQEVLSLLGRKWVLPIVRALLDGPRRNFQLLSEIREIQPKVLRETLRALERDGFVERVLVDDDCGGKSVAYRLTRLGGTLPGLMNSVFDWGMHHLNDVHAFRQADTLQQT